MNLLNSFLYRFSLLDLALGPSPSVYFGNADPATKAIVIAILILFLGFIGYLIWKSIRRKKDDN